MIRRMMKRRLMFGAVLTIVLVGIVAALVTAGGIVAWEYSNSNEFCTNACHAVHPEEPIAHAASFHARVNCVECHMGRVSTLELMALKPTHFNELWGMIVGYERPLKTHTMRPARESCEACHWPEARHNDTIRVKYRYADDATSTESRTTLQLHTAAGQVPAVEVGQTASRPGHANVISKGIHWHITKNLEYVALDVNKQKIPLIDVYDANGKVTETYFDATAGISRAEAEKLPRRRVDCIDCHNSVGHPFRNPANLVDDALEHGRIDRSLPSIKARSNAIIKQTEGFFGSEAERGARFDEIIAAARPGGEQNSDAKANEQRFAEEMKRILLISSFATQGVAWKSFPDNTGHMDFPGCFRCHDGKHLNGKGEAVRLQCTLCHALPQVVAENGVQSVPSTVSPGLTPPASHEEPNFMHDHRTKIDDSCGACHGKIQWGTEGGSFCSNPACHGRKWPEMSLDLPAATPVQSTSPAAPPTPATPAKSK